MNQVSKGIHNINVYSIDTSYVYVGSLEVGQVPGYGTFRRTNTLFAFEASPYPWHEKRMMEDVFPSSRAVNPGLSSHS